MSLIIKIINKYKLVSVLFLFISQFAFGTNDTIFTSYKNGVFVTECKVQVNASGEIMNAVIDDYVYQTKYDLDELFKWALKGLKLRKEVDDLIVFNFKSTKFDEKTGLIRATGDVEVPNVVTFPDIHVDSKMTKTEYTDGRAKVVLDVKYSDAFLKKTTGNFQLIPVSNRSCQLSLQTKVEFGWFFNIFITTSSFKSIMEWRFEKLLNNIKAEAEKREKLTKTSPKQ